MTPLAAYIEAWTHGDVPGVLAVVEPDCVVIESHGPVHRGAERIEAWMTSWLRRGVVRSWILTEEHAGGLQLWGEWTFACTFDGREASFDGASVARLRDGRIAQLREYATTAPLYDWSEPEG